MSVDKLNRYAEYLTNKNMVIGILIASIMLVIFVTDLQFTKELYIGVLYIIVVMLSLWLPSVFTIMFASISTLLTMFGYFYSIYAISPTNYFHLENFINLSMTISVIWITTIIAMYIKGINNALRKSATVHEAILDTSIDPIIIIDKQGTIESASTTLEKTFGWPPEDIKGETFYTLLSKKCRGQYADLLTSHDTTHNSSLLGNTHETIGLHRIQREFPCELSINCIEIPGLHEPFFTAVLRDISARKAYEKKLSWISSHDELTKIYNRRFFNEQIEKEWCRLLRSKESLAIIILDVDFFKNYNDSLGHQAGDLCLQTIATCLEQSGKRASDVVARYGGEEFIVLLPNTDLSGAELVATSIKNKISNLNIIHPNSAVSRKVSVSQGVTAMVPMMGCSYERLIRFADQALYEAKQTGRNKICVYTE